jgi:hypothetical protein
MAGRLGGTDGVCGGAPAETTGKVVYVRHLERLLEVAHVAETAVTRRERRAKEPVEAADTGVGVVA